jgi:hypothetical protein
MDSHELDQDSEQVSKLRGTKAELQCESQWFVFEIQECVITACFSEDERGFTPVWVK